jgi:hypothetical protein
MSYNEENSEKNYFINTIEGIYGQFDGNFPRLKFFFIVIFLINTLNFINFWGFNYMIAQPKTMFFCYDNKREFKLCKKEEICNNSKSPGFNLFYTDNKLLTKEENVNIQLKTINDHFRSVMLFDFIRFNSWNKLKNKSEKISKNYSYVIGLTKNEDFNIYSKYNLACKESDLDLIGLFMFVFIIIFPIIFGYLADLFGRKKILIILMIMQIAGGIIFFFADFYIEKRLEKINTKLEIYEVNEKKTTVKSVENVLDLNEFIPDSLDPYINRLNNEFMTPSEDKGNKFSFLISKLDPEIQRKYHFMEKSLDITIEKNNAFTDCLSVIILATILKFCTIPCIFNICLCYVMELSFNADITLSNYNFTIRAYVFSYALSYFFIVSFNNIFQSLGIVGIIQLIMLVLFIYFDIESPRYCYENSQWENLTNIIKKNILNEYQDVDQTIIKRLIERKRDDPIYKQEIDESRNRNIKDQFFSQFEEGIFFFSYSDDKNHLKSPFFMFSLFEKNKYFRDSKFILFAIIINFAIVYYLISTKYSTDFFITREFLYSENFLNKPIIINFFLILLVNYIYGLSSQIYGYPFMMSISYLLMLIFAIIIGINKYLNGFTVKNLDEFKDYNLHYKKVEIDFFIHALVFLSNGLYLQLFIYVVQYSLTICRATFFGIIQSIFFSIFLISISTSRYFIEMFDIFIIQCCIVGNLVSYFVVKGDGSLIKDFRILEIKEK